MSTGEAEPKAVAPFTLPGYSPEQVAGAMVLGAEEMRKELDAALRAIIALQKELDECKKEAKEWKYKFDVLLESKPTADDLLVDARKEMLSRAKWMVDLLPDTTDDNRRSRISQQFAALMFGVDVPGEEERSV